MIKTTLRGLSLNIDFEYAHNITKIGIEELKKLSATKCVIEFGVEKSFGIARVSASDNPNKRVGRRISLKKALNEYNFTKEERGFLWSQYLVKIKK